MPGSGDGFEQGYSAQATVATETMLVVATHVSQAPNDKCEIAPTLATLDALPEALGEVQAQLADSGYFSAANTQACEALSIEPLLAIHRQSHHVAWQERFVADAPPPKADNAVTRMVHRLQTKAGRARYRCRCPHPSSRGEDAA